MNKLDSTEEKKVKLEKELEARLQMIPAVFDRRKMRGIIQRIRTMDKAPTPPPAKGEEWEKRLRILWKRHPIATFVLLDETISFIHNLLSHERQAERERIHNDLKKIAEKNTDEMLGTTDIKGFAEDVADYSASLTTEEK